MERLAKKARSKKTKQEGIDTIGEGKDRGLETTKKETDDEMSDEASETENN